MIPDFPRINIFDRKQTAAGESPRDFHSSASSDSAGQFGLESVVLVSSQS
jgi:hypothetical protein